MGYRWRGFVCASFAGMTMALGSVFAAAEEVRFVVFGDSQLDRAAQFERMVHEANFLRPHFATTTGDMIIGYTDDEERIRSEWRRFKKQIEPLAMPFYPVPGNHDVETDEARRIYGEIWGEDRYRYSYDYGPVHCIVLDSYHPEAKDAIGPAQFEWLRNHLESFAEEHGGIGSEELNARSIFVFVHSAFWRYDPPHDGIESWERVHALLSDYPVRMVIGGNTDRHHEYSWDSRDGIDYVMISAAGNFPQENERAGFFHGFLYITVADGEVHTAVITPGSIFPMDTVSIEERVTLPRYGLRDRTMRIPAWAPGEELAATLSAPIENRLDEPREFELRWEFPRGSDVEINPPRMWVEVPAGGSVSPEFELTAQSAPSVAEMPVLHVEARNELRSGVVNRRWEAHYREEIARANAGEDILTTSIELDREYTFGATYSIAGAPRATAARWQGAMMIDGVLDEPSWARTEPVTDFKHSGSGDPAPYKTSVRYLYDDSYLYVGVWMEEPAPENLKADAGGEIALTWNDDDIELFFDPSMEALDHTRIFENPEGTRFNGKPIGTPDRYAIMDYQSAIHLGEDHWSIEFRIPWSDIPDAGQPEPGTVWGINLWRHRQQSDPPRFYWAVDAYDQGRYGFLEFK